MVFQMALKKNKGRRWDSECRGGVGWGTTLAGNMWANTQGSNPCGFLKSPGSKERNGKYKSQGKSVLVVSRERQERRMGSWARTPTEEWHDPTCLIWLPTIRSVQAQSPEQPTGAWQSPLGEWKIHASTEMTAQCRAVPNTCSRRSESQKWSTK